MERLDTFGKILKESNLQQLKENAARIVDFNALTRSSLGEGKKMTKKGISKIILILTICLIFSGCKDTTDGENGSDTLPLENWTVIKDSTFNFNGIAYGNGKFVAYDVYNNLAYSSDGITWTQVETSPFSDDFMSSIHGITYGSGKFVAIGFGKIAYSPDGITWTLVENPPFNRGEAITYGNGLFMAQGLDQTTNRWKGVTVYSSDGINWTQGVNTVFDDGTGSVSGITYGGGKFIMAGDSGKILFTGAPGRMAYSSDGKIWSPIAQSVFLDTIDPYDHAGDISDIAYGGGTFVITGYSGKVGYSLDGITWTQTEVSLFDGSEVSSSPVLYAPKIAYGGGYFVIVGAKGKIFYSFNGRSWIAAKGSDFYGFDRIAYGNGKFVAVGLLGIAYSGNLE